MVQVSDTTMAGKDLSVRKQKSRKLAQGSLAGNMNWKNITFMKYIVLIASLFLFPGCKKSEEATLYISGTIYNNCYDREPVRNYNIRLIRTQTGSDQHTTEVATGSTDENGNFKLFFPPSDKVNSMRLKSYNGGEFMTGIPPIANIENIEIFSRIYSNVKVSLNVINPHSIGDTLGIKQLGSLQTLNIPCPLFSGPIYTTLDYTPVEPMGFYGTRDYIAHGFFPPFTSAISTSFTIDKYCQDTVYVTVDIE